MRITLDFNLTDPENGPVLDDSLPNSVHEYVSQIFFNSEYLFVDILGKKTETHKQMYTQKPKSIILYKKI